MRTLPTDYDLRDGTNDEYCTQAVGWTADGTSAVRVSTLPTRNQRFIELSSALGDRPWEERRWGPTQTTAQSLAFWRYAKRGPRVPVQSAPSADDTTRPQPTTSDEKSTTSALTPSAATRRRRRQPKSVEIVESSPSPPAVELPRRPTSPTTWPCQHRRADQRLRPVRRTTCSLILPTKKLPPR